VPTAMSAKQIAQVAYNAGWRGEELVTATAVALAESSGRYWVVNSIGCVGLWQINVPVHKQWTTAAMKDPAQNAAAAMTLYNGAKSAGRNPWSPWEAYTGPDGRGSDGPYTLELGRARIAAAQIKGGGSVTVPASDATGGGTGSGTVDEAAFETISGGGALLGGGLGMLLGGPAGGLIGTLLGLGGDAADGTGGLVSGGVGVAKGVVSLSLLAARSAAWISNPRNWLRVVEVLGGAVALFIGLRMLSNTGVSSPVATIATAPVNAATKVAKTAAKTAKTAGEAAVVA
jgi:hypothetical protein